MILGDPAAAAAHGPRGITIDAIFRSAAERHPHALALVDPANRESFTAGEPRRLTYAQAESVVTAIAGRLCRMGLPTDAIIGVHLPNIVENILTILGILRAGMIAAPLPLLWRRADAVAALTQLGAKALITCGRVGGFNQGQFAMTVAMDVFSIRYVCAFGGSPPDGVVAFDDLFDAGTLDSVPPLERAAQVNGERHVAAITFEVGENGVVPVARNHAELLAGGLAVLLEAALAGQSNVLSTIAPSSFAGICLTLLPWLLSGGTLVLHHPFEPSILVRQRREEDCTTLMLPAAVAFAFAETSAFAVDGPACIVAAWHAPERLAASAHWRDPNILLVDVPIFGETAVLPARRGADGKPRLLPYGAIRAPRGSADGAVVAELTRTDWGTIALRGPMVPHHAFPPGIERSGLPHFRIGSDGRVDSGYTCRINAARTAIAVTAAPAGLVSIGGYRFPLRDLQEAVGRIDMAATLAAAPDPVVGQRLIGDAADRRTMQAVLNTLGVNPLLVAAFRDRSERDLSATSAA